MIERHGKRLGRIPGAHAYAKEWTKGFSEVWKGKGGTLLTNNEIDYNTTTDFSSVASKALSEKPDVLFVGGPSQATALVIKAAREQGFKGGFVVMDQAKFEEMNKLVPMEMLENSVGVMPMIHHPDFRAAKFVEKYRQKKGADRDPPREVSLTYGAMRILARAMELAGTTTDAKAIHAKADEAAATLPDEFKPSELLGVEPQGISNRPPSPPTWLAASFCRSTSRHRLMSVPNHQTKPISTQDPRPKPSMAELIHYDVRDRVAVLTIDNPPVNAMGPGVLEGIEERSRANADPGVDAIVLIGAGTTFIAGADIKIFGTLKTREQSLARSEATHARLKRIEDSQSR